VIRLGLALLLGLAAAYAFGAHGGWDAVLPTFSPADGPMATRAASGKALNAAIEPLPTLVGGSADLGPSTKTYLEGHGDLTCDSGFVTMQTGLSIGYLPQEPDLDHCQFKALSVYRYYRAYYA